MFCCVCFNVFTHNRKDHAKNFSFVYDTEKDHWHVSPAYDLTYSTTLLGRVYEHCRQQRCKARRE